MTKPRKIRRCCQEDRGARAFHAEAGEALGKRGFLGEAEEEREMKRRKSLGCHAGHSEGMGNAWHQCAGRSGGSPENTREEGREGRMDAVWAVPTTENDLKAAAAGPMEWRPEI